MKLERGYAVLEPKDDGLTVYKALLGSLNTVRQDLPEERSWLWTNAVLNAKGALQSNYTIVDDEIIFPDDDSRRSTPLYISPDDLEFALVAYGIEDIERHGNQPTPETIAVDGLLKQVDQIKPSTN